MNELLQVVDLKTTFYTDRGPIPAVDGVTLDIGLGEVLGVVGESGCGKSTLGLSILRLVPPPGRIVGGKIFFQGTDLLTESEEAMRHYRGRLLSMVLQDPMTSLNPVLTVGYQVAEPLRFHLGLIGSVLRDRVVSLLGLVGIPSPADRVHNYPHRFSGGMRQRVVTAMALAGDPKLLIADEPTTALDVTIQAQILSLLADLQQRRDFSVMLITHDMGIVARVAQRVAVMYAGRIVETAPVQTLFHSPRHPYTVSLLESVPRLGHRRDRLASVPGQPPSLAHLPAGCRFAPRCRFAMPICTEEYPPEFRLGERHLVACWLHHPESPEHAPASDATSSTPPSEGM